MKKLIYSILILLFVSVNLRAEIITGYVSSAKTGKAITGVNVLLLQSGGGAEKSNCLTDIKGMFLLQADSIKNCVVAINPIGYTPVNIIIKSQGDLDLGVIELDESTVQLNEIVVQGEKIIQKVDRYIIMPTADELARAKDSFKLLQDLYLPGLVINNLNNNATINGSEPVFQINGIPKGKEDILAINPDNIIRIEYSDTPSIRYINDNVGGVINFIIKGREAGGSMYSNLYASPTTGLISGSVGAKMNYKKSEFSLSVSEDWRKSDKTRVEGYEGFIGREFPINEETIVKPMLNNSSTVVNLSYLYQHDEKTVFNIAFLNRIISNKGNGSSVTNREYNNELSELSTTSETGTSSYVPSLDIFFKKELKNNQSIEANVVGSLFNSEYNRTMVQHRDDKDNIFNNNIDNSRWSLIAEVVYHKSFNKITTNWGVKNKYSNTKNIYSPLNSTSKLSINDNYIYGEVLGAIKKVSYSLGTGLKSYYEQNDNIDRVYFRNITTLKLLYKCKKNLTFDYLLMYNPTLPSTSQVENVYQVVNDIIAKEGNPNLKPSEWVRNRLLITYNWSKYRARFWGIYDYTFSPIIADMYYDNIRNYFVSKSINTKYNTKVNLQLDLSANKLLNHFNVSTSVGWNKVKSAGIDFNHLLSNIYWNVNATYYTGAWSLSVNVDLFPQKQLIGEMIIMPSQGVNVSAQYSYKNFIFSASIYNPFSKDKYADASESLSKVHPTNIRVINNDYANMVAIGVVYRTSWGKEFKRMRKNLSNSDRNDSMIIAE